MRISCRKDSFPSGASVRPGRTKAGRSRDQQRDAHAGGSRCERPGRVSRGGLPRRPSHPRPNRLGGRPARTNHAHGVGRRCRKKRVVFEVVSDMPGGFPGPSLGGGPREIGPAVDPHGRPRPTVRVGLIDQGPIPSTTGRARRLEPSGRQSRGLGVLPDSRPSRASRPRDTTIGGGRVHRGEPLLLEVVQEYQITYRRIRPAP